MEITVNSVGALNVAEDINGSEHRRCLVPTDSLVGEPQEVIDAANAAWTPEVIAAYKALVISNIQVKTPWQLTNEANSLVMAELDAADLKIIRAITENDNTKISAHVISQALLRSKLK